MLNAVPGLHLIFGRAGNDNPYRAPAYLAGCCFLRHPVRRLQGLSPDAAGATERHPIGEGVENRCCSPGYARLIRSSDGRVAQAEVCR